MKCLLCDTEMNIEVRYVDVKGKLYHVRAHVCPECIFMSCDTQQMDDLRSLVDRGSKDEYISVLEGLMPACAVESMREYVSNGRPLGGFLTAVFANDLFGAHSRADSTNARLIRTYVEYIYNYLPHGCWGSYEIVDRWIKEKRGME